ncbi:MAG TPA: type II toxin-antitoxin system RelE/ParE family toxin [Candidatus Merdenecus merdavium]|nr:type II toxin-antitoxin system RelE/ParE family toxin [Candidatus Merdenecus merdavium]
MKQYIVDITEEALKDMDMLYDYIAVKLKAPENATRQYDRIASAILSLNELPERYRVMDSEPQHSQELRMMPVDNYTVFYIIDEVKVKVTNVLYSASDINARLRS